MAAPKPEYRSRCCDKPWYSNQGVYVCSGCEAPWTGRPSEMPDVGIQSFQPTDPVEIEQKRSYLKWTALAHYVYHQLSATDNTYIAAQHPLCPTCNPDLLKGDKRPWLDVKIERTRSNGSQIATSRAEDVTCAPTATALARPTTETAAGPVEDLVGRAADRSSWAYEARQAYLQRKLASSPFLSSVLTEGGLEIGRRDAERKTIKITGTLWTGRYDDAGLPIPAENPAWFREVWPVYNGPDPLENKRRSLRDTLIVSPESGPRLIACGLWTGEYDAEGLPIPA